MERKSYSIPPLQELSTECLRLVQQEPLYLLIPLFCFLALGFGLTGLSLSSQDREQKLIRLQLESLRLRQASSGTDRDNNLLKQAQLLQIMSRLDRLETEQEQFIQKLTLIQSMQTGLSEKFQTQLVTEEQTISTEFDNGYVFHNSDLEVSDAIE